jgi:hypothetical protein
MTEEYIKHHNRIYVLVYYICKQVDMKTDNYFLFSCPLATSAYANSELMYYHLFNTASCKRIKNSAISLISHSESEDAHRWYCAIQMGRM